MKSAILLLSIGIIFSHCDTPKSTQTGAASDTGGGTASKRWNMPEQGMTGNSDGSDTLIVSGTQYIPIHGKSETEPDIEGTWELESINGVRIPGRSGLKPEVTAKVAQDYEKANRTGEYRRDSITTQTATGIQKTTESYFYEKSNDTSIRITPPQGGNYHIPEKPRLSFYGLNETFSGFTGCNKISGRFIISDSTHISLGKAAPSTKMVCMGDYDETSFVNALHRVNTFKLTKSQLDLMAGSEVVLSFSRKD